VPTRQLALATLSMYDLSKSIKLRVSRRRLGKTRARAVGLPAYAYSHSSRRLPINCGQPIYFILFYFSTKPLAFSFSLFHFLSNSAFLGIVSALDSPIGPAASRWSVTPEGVGTDRLFPSNKRYFILLHYPPPPSRPAFGGVTMACM
jgi:hypothetical protein